MIEAHVGLVTEDSYQSKRFTFVAINITKNQCEGAWIDFQIIGYFVPNRWPSVRVFQFNTLNTINQGELACFATIHDAPYDLAFSLIIRLNEYVRCRRRIDSSKAYDQVAARLVYPVPPDKPSRYIIILPCLM